MLRLREEVGGDDLVGVGVGVRLRVRLRLRLTLRLRLRVRVRVSAPAHRLRDQIDSLVARDTRGQAAEEP